MEPNQTSNQAAPQGGAAPSGSAKTLSALVVLVMIIAGGWYLYKSGAFKRGVENAPTISREQLVGEKPLSSSLENAITAHKKEILDRIATVSANPLSDAEREALGKTMLMEAHLYHFTDAETTAIFAALKPTKK